MIREAIERDYLKPTRPPLSRVVREIRDRCQQAGLAPPNWRTIKARVSDLYLREHHPYFRRPATLLLTIGVRLPVLAGIGIVAARPGYWAERLLSGAGKANWKRLMTCFRSLIAASSNNVSPAVSGYPALMGCSEGRQHKFSLIAA